MIDLSKLSSRYSTRALDDSDVDIILDLCRENPLFNESALAQPTAQRSVDQPIIITILR